MDAAALTPLSLPADHPGVSDLAYRARRAAIAEAGARHRPGDDPETVAYAPEEDEVWRQVVARAAAPARPLRLSPPTATGAAALDLRRDRVPQLQEVSERLAELTGFRIQPVGGLVPTRQFYGSLADRCFLSTQYIRHHSVPFYTPEPDVVHEVIGHANMLADPRLAELYQLAGQASRRATRDEALEFFSRVFWFTLEFGVLWEDGELRTYGAGLLSSYGEIQLFARPRSARSTSPPWASTDYDITRYQPVLFAARSFTHAYDELGRVPVGLGRRGPRPPGARPA